MLLSAFICNHLWLVCRFDGRSFDRRQVREDLQKANIMGIMAYEAQGFGRQRGHKEVYRGSEYQVYFIPKIVLEVAVEDDQVDLVFKTIIESARSGKIGDGKIFIMDLAEVIRIRTGETGEHAL